MVAPFTTNLTPLCPKLDCSLMESMFMDEFEFQWTSPMLVFVGWNLTFIICGLRSINLILNSFRLSYYESGSVDLELLFDFFYFFYYDINKFKFSCLTSDWRDI
ncbi:hypothetical protein NE237_013056 [Protea cynaroides]|uniref:Transmembrane protein n=1 Tax=Protea cynaroides TaxID=273540 RepID=A0A9Q0H110_9MAGN|nr:hypothetical protein NE237_013056 [Protea cynaroides]